MLWLLTYKKERHQMISHMATLQLVHLYSTQLYKYALLLPHVGILCGQCTDGAGVTALLNRCVHCSNTNAILIVAIGNKQIYFNYNYMSKFELFIPHSADWYSDIIHSTFVQNTSTRMVVSIFILYSSQYIIYTRNYS